MSVCYCTVRCWERNKLFSQEVRRHRLWLRLRRQAFPPLGGQRWLCRPRGTERAGSCVCCSWSPFSREWAFVALLSNGSSLWSSPGWTVLLQPLVSIKGKWGRRWIPELIPDKLTKEKEKESTFALQSSFPLGSSCNFRRTILSSAGCHAFRRYSSTFKNPLFLFIPCDEMFLIPLSYYPSIKSTTRVTASGLSYRVCMISPLCHWVLTLSSWD